MISYCDELSFSILFCFFIQLIDLTETTKHGSLKCVPFKTTFYNS